MIEKLFVKIKFKSPCSAKAYRCIYKKNNSSRKTTSVASKNKAFASLKVNIGSLIKVGEIISTIAIRYHVHWDIAN